jgi:hypothetical protein
LCTDSDFVVGNDAKLGIGRAPFSSPCSQETPSLPKLDRANLNFSASAGFNMVRGTVHGAAPSSASFFATLHISHFTTYRALRRRREFGSRLAIFSAKLFAAHSEKTCANAE